MKFVYISQSQHPLHVKDHTYFCVYLQLIGVKQCQKRTVENYIYILYPIYCIHLPTVDIIRHSCKASYNTGYTLFIQ